VTRCPAGLGDGLLQPLDGSVEEILVADDAQEPIAVGQEPVLFLCPSRSGLPLPSLDDVLEEQLHDVGDAHLLDGAAVLGEEARPRDHGELVGREVVDVRQPADALRGDSEPRLRVADLDEHVTVLGGHHLRLRRDREDDPEARVHLPHFLDEPLQILRHLLRREVLLHVVARDELPTTTPGQRG